MEQRHDGGYLHLTGFHLMPKELWRSSHHQSTDEHSDDDKGEVVHPANAYTTKPGVDLHIEHLNHSRQGHRGVVHRVDRTVGGDCCCDTPQRSCGRTNAHLLAFHCPAILCNAHVVYPRITLHLLTDIDAHAYEVGK